MAKVNVGSGSTIGSWLGQSAVTITGGSDAFYTGATVDQTGVSPTIPDDVARSIRYIVTSGSFTITLTGLTASAVYNIDIYRFVDGNASPYEFSLTANGVSKGNFEYEVADANDLLKDSFQGTADGSGEIDLVFTVVTNAAFCNALEYTIDGGGGGTITELKIDCGRTSSPIIGWELDDYFTNGSTFNQGGTPDFTGLSEHPPSGVFQYNRYLNGGTLTYDFTDLVPDSYYKFTLWFYLNTSDDYCEFIAANGSGVSQVTYNVANRVRKRQFYVVSDGSGEVVLTFTQQFVGIAGFVSAIELILEDPPVNDVVRQIVCEGDSITEGYPYYDTSFPDLLASLLGANSYKFDSIIQFDPDNTMSVYNVGQQGDDFSDLATQAATQVNARYDATLEDNIYVCLCGSNDLTAGRTLAQMKTDVETNFDNAGTAGYNRRVTCTIPPRVEVVGAVETIRLNYNSWLRLNYTDFAEYIADFAGNPDLQNTASANYVDGVHPSASGYAVMAQMVYDALDTGELTLLTTSPLADGTVGVPYNLQFTHSGGGTVTYGYTGTLPPGMTFDTSGEFDGTPTLSGNYTFYVYLIDNGVPEEDLTIFTIRIDPSPTELAITTEDLPNGIAGVLYSQYIFTSGGANPISNPTPPTVTAGDLPDGLTLSVPNIRNVGALLSGVPTVDDSFTFTIEITDHLGEEDTETYTILIENGAIPLVITSISQIVAFEDNAIDRQLDSYGGAAGTNVWAKSGGTFPAGVTLNTSGLLSGTPTTPGDYLFTISVTDSAGEIATKQFYMTVLAVVEEGEDMPGADFYTLAPQLIRARYFEAPKDWDAVTSEHGYADGGKSFNELADNAPQTWEVVYDGMTEAEAADFDDHYESFRKSRPFQFKTKEGTTLTDVYYKEFEKSHEAHKSWIQTRRILFIRYP